MQIIFVDDETKILQGLRRILRPMRQEWQMRFFSCAQEALDALESLSCDVVVSDMKMPGMDGAEFLSRVRSLYPQTIRIALSGQSEPHLIYRCIQNAHQYMAKPCEIEVLTKTVQRARMLQELLEDEQLRTSISGISTLPSLPQAYSGIMDEMQAQYPSLERIGNIVESDVAMSAKLLQIVNSSFFGLMRTITSPTEAASYLGLDVLQSLALTAGVFSQFEQSSLSPRQLGEIWNKSVQTGAIAKYIAKELTDDKILIGNAMMGGMMANIGKLVIAANFPDKYIEIESLLRDTELSPAAAESAVIGHSQTTIGSYLLCIWGLANPVVECVLFSDTPADCVDSRFIPLTAVHIAKAIVNAQGSEDLAELDLDYLEKTGLADKVAAWVVGANQMENA